MISDEQIKQAVEEEIIKELRRQMLIHLDEVLEDVLVETMQKIVIKMYRSNKLKGINFDIEIQTPERD